MTKPHQTKKVLWAIQHGKKRRNANLDAKADAAGIKEVMLPSFGDPTTEFEIQAFLYSKLLESGFKVRGELRTKCERSRFDLVLFGDDKKPVEIIEVKRRHKHLKKNPVGKAARTEQIKRYKQYGIDVTVIYGMRQAKKWLQSLGIAVTVEGAEMEELDREFRSVIG